MGRRSAQSVRKRARDNALREKRELKKAKKDARVTARLEPGDLAVDPQGVESAEASE